MRLDALFTGPNRRRGAARTCEAPMNSQRSGSLLHTVLQAQSIRYTVPAAMSMCSLGSPWAARKFRSSSTLGWQISLTSDRTERSSLNFIEGSHGKAERRGFEKANVNGVDQLVLHRFCCQLRGQIIRAFKLGVEFEDVHNLTAHPRRMRTTIVS